jgi:PAS domain-containing protein
MNHDLTMAPLDFARLTLDNMQDAVAFCRAVTDDAGAVKDFEILDANKAFHALRGYDPSADTDGLLSGSRDAKPRGASG